MRTFICWASMPNKFSMPYKVVPSKNGIKIVQVKPESRYNSK